MPRATDHRPEHQATIPPGLAMVDDDGRVLAAGDNVAAAVERGAVDAYRLQLQARGHLRAVAAV